MKKRRIAAMTMAIFLVIVMIITMVAGYVM